MRSDWSKQVERPSLRTGQDTLASSELQLRMSALTSGITDAAAGSPTAEAALPLADLSTAAPTNVASTMEGPPVEPTGVSERCSHPASSQVFALWVRKNIRKKECCFFDRDKR